MFSNRLDSKGGQGGPVGSDLVEVDCGSDDADVVNIKLRSLGQQFSIADNNGPTVVVQSSTITSSLIGIQINPAAFTGGVQHEFQSGMEFPEFMMTAGPIANDFHPPQGQGDVCGLGRP